MNKHILKISFLILVCVCIIFNAKVKAEEIMDNPYIDISFEDEAKENKNHGTLDIFDDNKTEIYGNDTLSYGVDKNGTYMEWTSSYSNGGGFNLNVDKEIGEEYTIALKFSFTNTGYYDGGWKKIIDFQKIEDPDSGLYFYEGGKMQFYPENANGPRIKNNEVVDLLIRRNKETKKFEVYNRVDSSSVLCYEFTDSEDLSVLGMGLGFFHNDDYQVGEHSDGGKAYSVKIWDSWIDVDDVWAAMDKEKEDSINRYVCKKISGQESTETEAGWKDYYKCKDQEDGSYVYCEDSSCKVEIEDIEEWKKEKGYIPYSNNIKNPQTGDNVISLFVIGMVSILVFLSSIFIFKKK